MLKQWQQRRAINVMLAPLHYAVQGWGDICTINFKVVKLSKKLNMNGYSWVKGYTKLSVQFST